MACFVAPAGVAIVTTICGKKIPKKYHINWLNRLLWIVSAGLILEHAVNGEIVPYFPFLTALNNAKDTSVMIHEIFTTGLAILMACVAAWVIMVATASGLKKAQARQKSDIC
jgi:hypothetical protein